MQGVVKRVKGQLWDTMEKRGLLVLMEGVNDVLQGRGRDTVKQVAKGVSEPRAISEDVHIAVFTVPGVEGKGFQ